MAEKTTLPSFCSALAVKETPLIVLLAAHSTPPTAKELVRCRRVQTVGDVLSAVTRAPLTVVANASPLVPRLHAVFFRLVLAVCDVRMKPCCLAKDCPAANEFNSVVVVKIA